MSICIDLPWPSKDLSPNARLHWAAKARAVKRARQEAMWLAQAFEAPDAEVLDLVLTFSPPDRRRYDDDNLVARMKAARDGIADALGIDDSRFRLGRPRRGEPIKGGNVRVEIEAAVCG